MAEFAGKNQVSAATGASPFPAVYGRDPRATFDLAIEAENPEHARAHESAEHLADIHDFPPQPHVICASRMR